MADDPRAEPVAEYICAEFEVSADDAEVPTLAILGEADAHDPLRALLADEEALIEFATKARYDAVTGLPAVWDEETPDWSKGIWRAETRRACGAVLAALREVAWL